MGEHSLTLSSTPEGITKNLKPSIRSISTLLLELDASMRSFTNIIITFYAIILSMDIQQALYPNFTLFVQAGLFLVFVFLVNYLFVRPYTRVIEERDSITERSLQEAKKLKDQATQLLSEASKILEEGRRESNAIIEQARKEAERLKAEILQRVEAETQQEISKAVEEIRKALEEEKAKLEGKVEEIAKLIRDKLLEEAA